MSKKIRYPEPSNQGSHAYPRPNQACVRSSKNANVTQLHTEMGDDQPLPAVPCSSTTFDPRPSFLRTALVYTFTVVMTLETQPATRYCVATLHFRCLVPCYLSPPLLIFTNKNFTNVCLSGRCSRPAHPVKNFKHVQFIIVDAVETRFFGCDKQT